MEKVTISLSFKNGRELISGILMLICLTMLGEILIDQAVRIPHLVSTAYHTNVPAGINTMFLLERLYPVVWGVCLAYLVLLFVSPAKFRATVTLIAGAIAVGASCGVALGQFLYISWLLDRIGGAPAINSFRTGWQVTAVIVLGLNILVMAANSFVLVRNRLTRQN